MNCKKIITILIVTAMVIVNLPINQAEAISETNEVNNQLLENQFDEIKQEVYDELNIDYTDELDINLIDLEEESLHIETTFNS
ncbi:SAR2788 family putative toxin, partial [Planococcus sp. SIMBA_160]